MWREREKEREVDDALAFSLSTPALLLRPRPQPLSLSQKKKKSHPDVVLVADVGGTNARFVLTRVGEDNSSNSNSNSNGEEILHVVYPTSRHATFADALAALEREPGFLAPRAAAFAVAGPVARNRCEMTNLAWTIDGDFLSKKLGE